MSDLYDRYAYYIGSCVRRVAGGKRVTAEDVEDLTQQVLLSLLLRNDLARFDQSRASFTTFLFWRVRTVVSQSAVKRARDPLAPYFHESAPPWAIATDDSVTPLAERHAMATQVTTRIERRLRALPAGWKHRHGAVQVFRLLAEGYTPHEISERLHMPRTTYFAMLRKIRTEARLAGD